MNETRTRISVDAEWDGSRLDRFVRAVLPGLSFPAAQTLIRKRRVFLNGAAAGAGARLRPGDVVTIAAEPVPGAKGRPRGSSDALRAGAESRARPGERRGAGGAATFGRIGLEIAVLFEDEDLLVVDKPAGLPVQPGNRARRGSLLDLLAAYFAGDAPGPSDGHADYRGGGTTARRAGRAKNARGCADRKSAGTADADAMPPPFAAAPVHRLDRNTSGALVVAKTRTAARQLSRIFASGRAEKTYLAVVEGVPAPPAGTIDKPLRIEKSKRSRALAAPGGARAETAYRLVRKLPGRRALLEVRITTGRTHQIRAHLASIGHPVSGDRYYGARGGPHGRLLLHAWRLAFPHPVSGRPVAVTAPPPRTFRPRSTPGAGPAGHAPA